MIFSFSISGFLITTLLLRERDSLGIISLRDFYVRRTLRIWPLYYATLGFYVLLVLLLQRGTARGPMFFHYLPGYLTFTYTWFAFWSTSGAIFHLLLVAINGGTVLHAVGPSDAVSQSPVASRADGWFDSRALECQLRIIGPHPARRFATGRIGANISVSICLGVLLAHALHSKRGFQVLYSILAQKWSAQAGLLLMLLCLSAGPSWWLLQSATLFVLVGACVVREDNGLAWLLQFRPLAYIGTVSYGMYMLNTLVIDGLHPVLNSVGIKHPALTFLPFLGMTILVASLCYRYFESPFLALKTRFVRVSSAGTPRSVTAGEGVTKLTSILVDKLFKCSRVAFSGSRPSRQE